MRLTLERYLSLRKRQFMPKADLPLAASSIARLRVPNCEASSADKDARAVLTALWPGQRFEQVADQRVGTLHQVGFYQADGLPALAVRIGRIPEVLHDWSLLSEACVQPLVTSKSLAMGIPLATDCSRRVFDFDYQITPVVSGIPLSELDHDDRQLLPRLQQLARYLASLHSIPGKGFGLLKLKAQPSASEEIEGLHAFWSDYLLLNLDRHVHWCRQAGCLDADKANVIASLFERDVIEQWNVEGRLLHGDPGSPNCFFDAHELTVIDWEDALVGDPVFELAMWATFHPERRWARFFEAYYQSESSARTSDWEARFWLYFLRIALFKTAHRFLFQRADPPDRPAPSRRIQRALSALCAIPGK